MDVCVCLPDELGAWYAANRETLGRGWASTVLQAALRDEQAFRAAEAEGMTREEYEATLWSRAMAKVAKEASAGDAELRELVAEDCAP